MRELARVEMGEGGRDGPSLLEYIRAKRNSVGPSSARGSNAGAAVLSVASTSTMSSVQEGEWDGAATLQRQRKKAQLSALVRLDVRVPAAGKKAELQVSQYLTVADTISSVRREVMGGDAAAASDLDDADECGLFWIAEDDPDEADGIWLQDDRTLWSYRLQDGSTVEYKAKTPEYRVVRVVVPAYEAVGALQYDQFKVVRQALKETLERHEVGGSAGFGLYLARESLWLSPEETLSSYCLGPQDTLECKERQERISDKPKSVLLDVNLPQHGVRRKLLLPLTTTVGEVMNLVARKVNSSDDMRTYGLYLCPTPQRPGRWLEDFKFLASFNLGTEEQLEFRTKFRALTVEVNMAFAVPGVPGGRASVLVDDRTRAGEMVDMLTSAYGVDCAVGWALFKHDGEHVPDDSLVWDVSGDGAESLAVHVHRYPVTVALAGEAGAEPVAMSVSFAEPVSGVLQLLGRRFGVRHPAQCALRVSGAAADLAVERTLAQQNVRPGARLEFAAPPEAYQPGAAPGSDASRKTSTESARLGAGDCGGHMWDEGATNESNLVVDEQSGAVKSGTLNKLVERLTDSNAGDLYFLKTFLLTYQSFTSSRVLLNKLCERYHVVRSASMSFADFSKMQHVIQARVFNAMKQWLDTSPEFVSDVDLQKDILQFVRSTLLADHPRLAKQLRAGLERLGKQKEAKFQFDERPPEPKLPRTPSAQLSLFDFDPEEIARQLTLIEFRIFSSIRPSEMLGQAWNKESKRHEAKNVMRSIRRTNNVGLWVATAVLSGTDAKSRARTYSWCVQLASELQAIHNYGTLVAVVGGLNNAAIMRLKATLRELDRKTEKRIAELEDVVTPESNYKNLRGELHRVNPPCLPFLGVYTSDLTALDDGNPNFVRGLINFSKRRLVYAIISDLIKYQDKPFNFMHIPELHPLLTRLDVLGDSTLYQVSLEREPRTMPASPSLSG